MFKEKVKSPKNLEYIVAQYKHYIDIVNVALCELAKLEMSIGISHFGYTCLLVYIYIFLF